MNIIHVMWSVQLGKRDSHEGSASIIDEPMEEANCMPVSFTNQMMLILLDLLNQLTYVMHALIPCVNMELCYYDSLL